MRNEPINRISLPIIGKIKVGIKDEKGLPKSIDYFVSTGKQARQGKENRKTYNYTKKRKSG